MAVLGVYEGHNAGAALISDRTGAVIAAIEEERFSRIKNHDARPQGDGLPSQSIDWVLSVARAAQEPVDHVAIGLMEPAALAARALAQFDAVVAATGGTRLGRAAQLGLDDSGLRALPFDTQTTRVARAVGAVREAGVAVDEMPVTLVEHHLAHAAAAFLTAPVDESLVITLDGKGDDLSGSVWSGRGTVLQEMALIPTEHSLGHLYSAATVACGFRPQRDEGKFMALAAHGQVDPGLDAELRRWVDVDRATGLPVSHLSHGIVQGPYPDRVAEFHNNRLAALIAGVDRADVAATVQRLVEGLVMAVVDHHLAATGHDVIAVAGGLFANVSVNRRIGAMPRVRELHVHPGMTDSGIALGAAAYAYTQRTGRRPMPLSDVGIGPSYPADAAAAEFLSVGYRVERALGPAEDALAASLSQGEVVARFVGGCEYGPRALGHRSILAPAHDPGLLFRLNDRLGRSQVMPFAPIVLAEWAPTLFSEWEALAGPMRFMTAAVDCAAAARENMPGAVHVDGTARPQLVDTDSQPGLTLLLRQYLRLSGRMGLVNTSFNLHDEPIVCTPQDAARSADAARIRMVQVEDLVLVKDERALRQ